MKNIEPQTQTVTRTLCSFCSFACELGVVFDDFGIKGVEYIKDGSSQGRLCPRGSAAAMYLNHPRRLSMPVKNGKTIEWSKITKELKKMLEKPQNVAITFDRNITLEEYQSIIGFCNKYGIENIASTYFEPEVFMKRFVNEPFSIDEIDNAKMIIVLGDPFNQSPMISKALINWKLADRNNRLVVIDSINTHTAVYATDFLKVNVGAEPLLLCALAQEKLEGFDISSVTGVTDSAIQDISSGFKDTGKGLIITVVSFAHTYDPLLLAKSISRLSEFSGKQVVSLFEFAGFDGNLHFGSIVDLIKKKKIKNIINFGELFPYYYPQLLKTLRAVNVVSCSPINYSACTTLPVALNLEKDGTILTTFGKRNLSGNIRPASGAKTVTELLSLFAISGEKGKSLHAPEVKVDIKERIEKLIEKSRTSKKKSLKLIGEKIAYYYLAIFEKEKIKLNPLDARDLGIYTNDNVLVKSKHGEVELGVKLTTDVTEGVVAVPAESPEVKGLFDFEIDNGIVNFVPTEVELWRKE